MTITGASDVSIDDLKSRIMGIVYTINVDHLDVSVPKNRNDGERKNVRAK